MKALLRSLGFAAILFSASSAYAIPIGIVGTVDTLLFSTTLADSGSATEAAWIASVLGVSVGSINYTQLTNSGGSYWTQVTGGAAGLWAFDFDAAGVKKPANFLVKLGNTTSSHFLFQNNASPEWGVIDLGSFTPSSGNVTISSVSHVGAAGTVSIPEPASLSLLLFGLAGLGVRTYRKRDRG